MSTARFNQLTPRRDYVRHVARRAFFTGLLIVGSLAIGTAGYHGFEHLPWIDAFLNASMIMGGMGPVDSLKTEGGKLFASFYALYCGLLLIVAASLILAPVLHRFLHKFHIEVGKDDER